MNKNFKSRIPVLVTKQKSFNCSDEESLKIGNCHIKKEISNVNKIAKVYHIQKKTEKKINLQLEKSRNFKDSYKNMNVRHKSTSLKTNKKCVTNTTNKKNEKNIKIKNKNKPIACKLHMKSESTNKSIAKTFKSDKNSNDRQTVLSSETKLKSNSIEDKKENLPSPVCCSFEKDACTPIREQIATKQDCFPAQENVEFEANEFYRKMILSNAELSPSVSQQMPSLRLSALQAQRPSVYQKLQLPADPMKEALKALENICLSGRRIQQKNKSTESPRRETFRDSIYTPHGDPNEEFLKKLEDYRLKQLQKTDPRSSRKVFFNLDVHGIKKEYKLTQSPRKDIFRCSIYTPRGDPNEEFLKKLEDYRLKQLQKTVPRSTKKVTFNLNVQECTPQNVCDNQNNHLNNSEHRLTEIKEKSEENTPNSPNNIKNEITLNNMSPKHEYNNASNEAIVAHKEDSSTKVATEDDVYSECKKIETAVQFNAASRNIQRTIEVMTPDKSVCQNKEIPSVILKEISSPNSSPFLCDKKCVEKYTDYSKSNNMKPSEQKRNQQSAKIYTPKPISISSNSKICQSYSPELLVDRKSVIMTDLAPICTPLVLRTQAKNILFSPGTDDGPIPLKLDFAEEEKGTPKKETCRNQSSSILGNIVTFQKQLDDLADQECYLSLINENYPVICGRYMTNPVACILNEGDDMHFIPI